MNIVYNTVSVVRSILLKVMVLDRQTNVKVLILPQMHPFTETAMFTNVKHINSIRRYTGDNKIIKLYRVICWTLLLLQYLEMFSNVVQIVVFIL